MLFKIGMVKNFLIAPTLLSPYSFQNKLNKLKLPLKNREYVTVSLSCLYLTNKNVLSDTVVTSTTNKIQLLKKYAKMANSAESLNWPQLSNRKTCFSSF